MKMANNPIAKPDTMLSKINLIIAEVVIFAAIFSWRVNIGKKGRRSGYVKGERRRLIHV